jgi:hypothetical protein
VSTHGDEAAKDTADTQDEPDDDVHFDTCRKGGFSSISLGGQPCVRLAAGRISGLCGQTGSRKQVPAVFRPIGAFCVLSHG